MSYQSVILTGRIISGIASSVDPQTNKHVNKFVIEQRDPYEDNNGQTHERVETFNIQLFDPGRFAGLLELQEPLAFEGKKHDPGQGKKAIINVTKVSRI